MKQRLTLFLLLILLPILGFSQQNKDFILTLNQDTLFGKIKINLKSDLITFIHNKKRINFHAKTINSFSIYHAGNYKHYKTVCTANGKELFVQILKEGKLNLYKLQQNATDFYSYKLDNKYLVGSSDKNLITVTPNSFERFLKVLVKDHPTLVAQLDKTKFKDVPEIIASYNRM